MSGAGTYAIGEAVTINATPKTGGQFVCWYDGEVLVSSSASYTFNMPFIDTSYQARFIPNTYTVDLTSENLEKGSVTGSGTYDYLESVTITATPELGSSFLGWYNGASQVSTQASYTFSMPYNSLSYVAKFNTISYILTVTSEDTNKGTVIGSGTYPYKQSRSITATPQSGYSFVGWYEDETLISSDNPYTFTMPYNNLSYGAKFSTNSYALTLASIDINKGTVTGEGTFAYQSEVTVTATTIAGNEFIGWYEGATLRSTNLVLDSQDYHYSTSTRTIGGSTVYSNNYKESHIRSWLNDNFYNTAFSTEEKARIQTTTVDNSVASTGYSSNPFACANTSDKVFLLSYAEATSATYGLSTTTSRQLGPSAYAKAQGVYTHFNGFNYWWLRSPSNDYDYYARYVDFDGDVDYSNGVYGTICGVVPALWISL